MFTSKVTITFPLSLVNPNRCYSSAGLIQPIQRNLDFLLKFMMNRNSQLIWYHQLLFSWRNLFLEKVLAESALRTIRVNRSVSLHVFCSSYCRGDWINDFALYKKERSLFYVINLNNGVDCPPELPKLFEIKNWTKAILTGITFTPSEVWNSEQSGLCEFSKTKGWPKTINWRGTG